MISCDEYEYVEIACLFQYPIKITKKAGEVIECKALDTQYNASREECIKVNVEGTDCLVVLDKISKLEVCIDNPHFKQVCFT